MKINTDIIALRLLCTSLISIFFELKYPSANRFWYSGSSTSSLPTFIEKKCTYQYADNGCGNRYFENIEQGNVETGQQSE